MEIKQIKTSVPGYRPSLEERETIIIFNEADASARVYTHNPALIRKIDKLAEDRAGEAVCVEAEDINGVQNREYVIPKKWVRVNAPRVLSEETKAKYAERLRLAKLQKSTSETR